MSSSNTKTQHCDGPFPSLAPVDRKGSAPPPRVDITALPGLDTPLLFLLEGGRALCSKPFPFLGMGTEHLLSSRLHPESRSEAPRGCGERELSQRGYTLTWAVSSLSGLCAPALEPECLCVGAFPSMSPEIRADLPGHGRCIPGVTPVRRPRLSRSACSGNPGRNDLPTARTSAPIYDSLSTASRRQCLAFHLGVDLPLPGQGDWHCLSPEALPPHI